MMMGRWRATTGGKRLLRLQLAQWLAMAMVAESAVGKEFTLGSHLLDLGVGGSTGTAVLVGRGGHVGHHLLALFAAEPVVALMALDAFCIRCLGDAMDHHDMEGADALALALGVVCHGVPTDCDGALSADRLTVAATDLDDEDDDDKEDEEE
jgi:hypothetical protein